MIGIGKALMVIGGIIFVVGLLMQFVKIGKLPGDFIFQKGNTTFYFPMMTSIIISIVLSLLFFIINRFK
ncbi:DUF2905 domain-containing protein [Caldibacillus lycopersici]|uniref:DUF2905 domain-containing protein n=1 Tax=Perspicuibacillus lycopersici TaxID=1325689 RepID=A0AAE3IW74_9BACI|nr:DUF2905 domain-containing protein [Perspicuibacillus lycopersici]MCU9613994.1 DUF2905 domain-containing protein [Perspicuibacillus lycopersici]